MNKEKMKSVPGGVLGIVGGAVMLVGAFILLYAVVTIAELLEEGADIVFMDIELPDMDGMSAV